MAEETRDGAIDRYIVVGPRDFTIGLLENGNLAVTFSLPAKETGLAAGLGLAIQLTPAEALEFAQRLSKTLASAVAAQLPKQ